MDIEQASNQWHTVEEASKHGQESTASQDLLESFWSRFTGSSREMAQVRRDSSYPTENTRQQKIAKKKSQTGNPGLSRTQQTGCLLKAESTPQLSGFTFNSKMWSTITCVPRRTCLTLHRNTLTRTIIKSELKQWQCLMSSHSTAATLITLINYWVHSLTHLVSSGSYFHSHAHVLWTDYLLWHHMFYVLHSMTAY